MPQTRPIDVELRRTRRRVWAMAGTVAALFGGSVFALLGSASEGPLPPFLAEEAAPSSAPASPVRPNDDGRIWMAGSGSNLPLTDALLQARFGTYHEHVVLHPSIGTSGGLRALRDGTIDVALISRPIEPHEHDPTWVVTPYARVPVVFAVHPGVREVDISAAEVLDIYAGRRTHWANGRPIVVLQRERGDSSHRVVSLRLPEFDRTNEDAYREGRWRVLYHDTEMLEALRRTEGAIGLHGTGLDPRPPYRVLAFEGVAPSSLTVASGAYPFTKDLALVTVGPPRGPVRALLGYARSPAGERTIRDFGGIPLVQERP